MGAIVKVLVEVYLLLGKSKPKALIWATDCDFKECKVMAGQKTFDILAEF